MLDSHQQEMSLQQQPKPQIGPATPTSSSLELSQADQKMPVPSDAYVRSNQGQDEASHRKSSPTSGSSDSFSSYIHKDAAIVQTRSSSPRVGLEVPAATQISSDSLEDLDPELHMVESPRGRVQTRIMTSSATLDGDHSALPPFSFSRAPSAEAVSKGSPQIRPEVGPYDSSAQDKSAPQEPATISHSNEEMKIGDERTQGPQGSDPAELDLALDGKPGAASEQGQSAAQKAEIRRRRRTKPGEANILADAYAINAFPDQETRQQLADRVGMTVRAVSVWFQNRRQAEKKRSGRYGGSGIVGGGGLKRESRSASQALEGSQAGSVITDESFFDTSMETVASDLASTCQRTVLGPSSKDNLPVLDRPSFKPEEDRLNKENRTRAFIIDTAEANKENIPPWASAVSVRGNASSSSSSFFNRYGDLRRSGHHMTPLSRSVSKDLRDFVASPAGSDSLATSRAAAMRTFSTPRPELDDDDVFARPQVPKALLESKRNGFAPNLPNDEASTRSRRLLDAVLEGGRARSGLSAFRRSSTQPEALDHHSSDLEEDDERGARIMRLAKRTPGRSISSSSLSLLTTSGGRASIGNPNKAHTEAEAASAPMPSLNSRLPPHITAELRRQGIISSTTAEDEQNQKSASKIWERMMSSSHGSSDDSTEKDANRDGSNSAEKSIEEDEEITLKLVAHRRAAKAQAMTRQNGVRPDADARLAIQNQRVGPGSQNGLLAAGLPTVAGLGPNGLRRTPSLEWAAGRDRTLPAPPAGSFSSSFGRSISVGSGPLGSSKQPSGRPVKTLRSPIKAPSRESAKAAPVSEAAPGVARSTTQPKKRVPKPCNASTGPRKRPLSRFATYDENDSGCPLVVPSKVDAKADKSKRRRVENEIQFLDGLPALVTGAGGKGSMSPVLSYDAALPPPSMSHTGRPGPLSSTPYSGRVLAQHHSFPSFHSSSPSGLSISRFGTHGGFSGFEGIGHPSSPSGSIRRGGLSLYDTNTPRRLASPRESDTRTEVRRAFGDRTNETTAPTADDDVADESQGSIDSRLSDEWVSAFARDASAARRKMGDEAASDENVSPTAPVLRGHAHDDSGFFGSESEDEGFVAPKPVLVKNASASTSKAMVSHRRKGLTKYASSPVKSKGKRRNVDGKLVDTHDDRQAAELLLGLGMGRGSGSSSQP
ncbi:hypothetical protein IE53DRAFT_101006 [Violaceomyces palustris]|uniref:Uncharacterized protein n=1 Tax=Violaceomyces palustris TaxID=1673888 RepID=A0ACD0NX47_9BASI|nr:hypothetical protein IE53DRAFT_101006 [Violaceomyces palustris]